MSEAKDSPAIVRAVTAGYVIGVLGGTLQPLLVGALIDGVGLDAGRAGLLGSIELVAVAIASFALAPRMGTLSRRHLCIAGALLAALGDGSAAFAVSFPALAVCRALAGIGAGTVLSISNAAVAACRNPERVFAQSTILGTIAFTVLLAILPPAITKFGHRGAFGAMALVALVLVPLLRGLSNEAAGPSTGGSRAPAGAALGIATMLGATLLFFGQSGVWAFAERMATTAGLGPEAIGGVLAASTLAGLGGAGLAGRIGSSRGRTWPLVGSIAATGASLLALVYAVEPIAFSAVLVVNGIAYLFMLPYVLGVAAALDVEGRWSAATIGAATVGAALGPGVAGPIVAGVGTLALGWVVFAASLLAAALVAPVGLHLDAAS
jgi:predicted MFS family arabinose efflux permease